jgi:hypothetical protein
MISPARAAARSIFLFIDSVVESFSHLFVSIAETTLRTSIE